MLNRVYWKYSCVLSQIFDSQCQNVKHKHLWSSRKRSPWAGVQRRGYWEKCTHGSVDFIQTSSLCRKMLGKYLGVLSCRRSRIDARKISCKWIKVVDIFSVKARLLLLHPSLPPHSSSFDLLTIQHFISSQLKRVENENTKYFPAVCWEVARSSIFW